MCELAHQYYLFHCEKLHCWLNQKWCHIRAQKTDSFGCYLYPGCFECQYGKLGVAPPKRQKKSYNVKRHMRIEAALKKAAQKGGYRSVAALLLDLNSRMTIREMAEKLKISYYAIQSRLVRLND